MLQRLILMPNLSGLNEFLEGYDDVKLYNMGLFLPMREAHLQECRSFLQRHLTFPVQLALYEGRSHMLSCPGARPVKDLWLDRGQEYVYYAALAGRHDVVRWAMVHGLVMNDAARGAIQCPLPVRSDLLDMMRRARLFNENHLLHATISGDFQLVKELISVFPGQMDTVRCLHNNDTLDAARDGNQDNPPCMLHTIMIEAARHGRMDMIEWFEQPDMLGDIILADRMLAACYGTDMYEKLRRRGYAPGWTTCRTVIEKGHVDVALDMIDTVKMDRMTVICCAIRSNDVGMYTAVQPLIRGNILLRPNLISMMAEFKARNIFHHVLEESTPDDFERHCDTLMTVCARFGDIDYLKYLWERGCNRVGAQVPSIFSAVCSVAIAKDWCDMFEWAWSKLHMDDDFYVCRLLHLTDMIIMKGRHRMLMHVLNSDVGHEIAFMMPGNESIRLFPRRIDLCNDLSVWLLTRYPVLRKRLRNDDTIIPSHVKKLWYEKPEDRHRKLTILLHVASLIQ
jgi:hypothetical protein